MTLGWRASSGLGFYGSLGIAEGVRNRALPGAGMDGDDDRTFGYGYYPVAFGVEIGRGPMVLRAELFDPMVSVPGFDPGMGFAIQLGGKLKLWEAKSPRADRPAAPPPPRELTPEEENLDDG